MKRTAIRPASEQMGRDLGYSISCTPDALRKSFHVSHVWGLFGRLLLEPGTEAITITVKRKRDGAEELYVVDWS